MPSKEPKDRDTLAKGYQKMYKVMRQYREKLASGDMTDEDLWNLAYEKADKVIDDRMKALTGRSEDALDLSIQIQSFREAQEGNYRDLYEWNTANDETSLIHILDTECSIYEIDTKLRNTAISTVDRDRLMDRHSKLVELHAKLLSAAGIDRVTREKKKEATGPMEEWTSIKRRAKDHMDNLKASFPERARSAKTESELRDAMKYHLGVPFDGLIDVILREHRRVLGMDPKVEVE